MNARESIIRTALGPWYVPGKQYHSSLPPELATWYCYPSDSGHSILCVLKQHYRPGEDNTGYLVPVPVKTVLRTGYAVDNGYIVVDLPYDPKLGLVTPHEDDEF